MVGEPSQTRQGASKLILRGDAVRENGVSGHVKRGPRKRLLLALDTDRLDEGQVRLSDLRIQEVLIQLAPDRVVATPSMEHLAVGAQKEVEAVIRRTAAPSVEICVFDDQQTTALNGGPHAAQEVERLDQMLE